MSASICSSGAAAMSVFPRMTADAMLGSRVIRNGGHRLLRGAARTAGHEDEVKLALIAQAHELLL